MQGRAIPHRMKLILRATTVLFVFDMADILPFRKKTPAEKHKGKTLCRSGFHKWEIRTEKKFDVKQGRLITVYQCIRCGKIKNTAI